MILTKQFLIGLEKQVIQSLEPLEKYLASLNLDNNELLEDDEKYCLINKQYEVYLSYDNIIFYNKVELVVYNTSNKGEYYPSVSSIDLLDKFDVKRVNDIEDSLLQLENTLTVLNRTLKYNLYFKGCKTKITSIISIINKHLDKLTINKKLVIK